MPAARPPTLVEVARLAGVSLTTASKAINDKGRISEDTRARVMSAAAKLRYTPNQYARSLITGRTSTVGLIMYDSMTARFAVPIMLGAETALTEIDLALITADARGDAARFRELVESFNRRNVDGVLVIGDNNHLTPSVTSLSTAPVVYVYGRSDADPGVDTVHLVDDEVGGRLLVDHLIATGRRRIAHVTGPRGSTSVDHRLLGIRAAMHDAGQRLVGGVQHGAWTQRHGRTSAARLLARHPDLDAVLCGSDQIAAGVVEAAREAGRRIPDDLAVTGYDNWEPFALDTDPPLTTIEMGLDALGQAAALDLFAVLGGGGGRGGLHHHSPHLIVRRSSVHR